MKFSPFSQTKLSARNRQKKTAEQMENSSPNPSSSICDIRIQKQMSRSFGEILSPKNSFAKTSSALVPPPARILGGQSTKEKCPFLFRRNWSRANLKSKEHFSLVFAEALRGGGGADSFVQFPLEKGSRKVYDYSTRKPLLGVFLCRREDSVTHKILLNFCATPPRTIVLRPSRPLTKI